MTEDAPAPARADHPLEDSWQAFEQLAIGAKLIEPKFRRALKHAFYAGARSAFTEVIAAMQEYDAGELDGERRFGALEREIEGYFANVIGQGLIARVGSRS